MGTSAALLLGDGRRKSFHAPSFRRHPQHGQSQTVVYLGMRVCHLSGGVGIAMPILSAGASSAPVGGGDGDERYELSDELTGHMIKERKKK